MTCSIPGSGRSLGEGNSYSLQYSCLEDPLDRGAWWGTDHGVAKRWTRLSNLTHTPARLECNLKALLLSNLNPRWNLLHETTVNSPMVSRRGFHDDYGSRERTVTKCHLVYQQKPTGCRDREKQNINRRRAPFTGLCLNSGKHKTFLLEVW